MCHRARFFVLVTFLKNPEKNKDYNKCCLPFQPIFFFVPRESLPPCRGLWGTLHTGDDIDCNYCLLWEC